MSRRFLKSNVKALLARIFLIFLPAMLLVSCGDSAHQSAIKKQIEQVKLRPPKPIESLPVFKPLNKVTYQAQTLRSPFFRPEDVAKGDQPDVSRPKGPLEEFAIDALTMVGAINQNNSLWALILTPQGTVYPVTIGAYIGQNYGRIESIKPNEVRVVESVKVGSVWQKREATITLKEQ